MYVSPFEHPAELNERQRDAAKDQFKELFEDSPTVWDDEYECLLLEAQVRQLLDGARWDARK